MPQLINIHGPLASGKSTLTTLLRKKLHYIHVDRPFLKKALKPLGKPLAKRISREIAYLIIKGFMKLKKNIIVQEMSPTGLKNRLHSEMKKYHYTFYSFCLSCSLKTALKRNKLRKKRATDIHVKKLHKEFSGPEKEDVVIHTEQVSPQQAVDLIMKRIQK